MQKQGSDVYVPMNPAPGYYTAPPTAPYAANAYDDPSNQAYHGPSYDGQTTILVKPETAAPVFVIPESYTDLMDRRVRMG
jgi:hypothetical protein